MIKYMVKYRLSGELGQVVYDTYEEALEFCVSVNSVNPRYYADVVEVSITLKEVATAC